MIVDITNEVLTKLKTELVNVSVLTDYPSIKPTFPCVTFDELSNNTHTESVDSAGEKYNEVSFEVNIYSNAKNKVTQVKTIRDSVDAIMSGHYGMTRGFSSKVPNFLDASICRYILRYTCVVDSTKKIYRR